MATIRIHRILEQTFSKLKFVKTRLRGTMSQSRLKSLILMSVETDIIETLDVGNSNSIFLLPFPNCDFFFSSHLIAASDFCGSEVHA